MTATFTRAQAADVVNAASGERDAIQANLLDLDSSFGKRLLAGAALAGTTKQRWEAAALTLAALWETFSAYSAVVDRAVEAMAGRVGSKELAEITALLTGPSVQLARGPAPMARRDLADAGGHDQLTLAAAVAQMRTAFAAVTEVASAAEQVWDEIAGPLHAADADLGRAASALSTLGDETLAGEVTAAQAELARLRGALNTDPLAFWSGSQVIIPAADRLRDRAAAAAARAAELGRLRDGARQRIAEVTAAAAAARTARADATAGWQRAAAKIATSALPPPPAEPQDLSARLASLDALLAAGRWARLESELNLISRQFASVTREFRAAERTVAELLGRRDELRGLLDAYEAKAVRLGAVEDPLLAPVYDRARELLWAAPCDLTAAADAVTGYQQAVLAIGARQQ
jgi:hypothetical protein